MGINGLSSFLAKKAPHYRRLVPTEWFANKWIAVDTYLLGYAYMSTAIGGEAKKVMHTKDMKLDHDSLMNKWLSRFMSTIATMKEAKMNPVFVFDGKPPIEKELTRNRRNENKNNVRNEINQLQSKLEDEDLETDIATRERITKLLARDVRITPQHWNRLINLLKDLGIPVIKAKGEGEALCATLVRNGECYAVFTQDSDAGAYLTPRVITRIDTPMFTETGKRVQQCEVIYYNQVFQKLELSPEQFVDLCCMCSNDYSDNIPNWGPNKCYNLLIKYGNIDNIPKEVYDWTPLNHHRVREIFNTPGEIEDGCIEEGEMCSDINNKLAGMGLLRSATRLLNLLKGSSSSSSDYNYYPPEDYDSMELL